MISDIPSQTLPPEGEIGVVDIGSLTLENGAVIDDVRIAIQRWGELSPMRDNVVVVMHALTGDSHITGPAGPGHPTAGWWDGVAGPGAPIDTNRWCAVATNVLGGCAGSTGPSSLARDGKPWGSRFPHISVRDLVEADVAALAALGIEQVAAVIGGSMGGLRALEWIVSHPDRVRAGLLLAISARTPADQIAHMTTQIAVIKADPNWQGGDYHGTGRKPDFGLSIARRFAHLTYRGEEELDTRFGNDSQGDEDPTNGGRYAVQSYLEYQGDKLVDRFDAGSYVALIALCNHHDVGRGRGGARKALRGCPVPVVVGGITSDRLYPLRLQEELAELLPGCTGLHVIESAYGHDGFLVEFEAVSDMIRKTLELAENESARPADSGGGVVMNSDIMISDIPSQTLPPEGEIGVVDIGSLTLENGAVIDDVRIAIQRWGELSPTRDNVVVVMHALTGDSHITGPAGPGHPTAGWWDGVAGPGAPIDTNRWCAVATNVLGGCYGSTGPSSLAPDGKPWGSRFPHTSVRDQVEADVAALAALGITHVAAVIGGSMGGLRAVEWMVSHPDRVRAGLLLATSARSTADQIGHVLTQVAAVKADPNWQGGDFYDTGRTPDVGMSIARRFAHLSYRGEVELDTRFGNDSQGDEDPAHGGRYAVQSYLEHHGDKLVDRFDAGTFVALYAACTRHDVGRGRGGVRKALRGCPVPVVVGGFTRDRLYPLRLQEELAELLPGCTGLQVVESIHGHDAFLMEFEAVSDMIRKTLELAENESA